ncbi:MAG: PspA/IM30 family protein [Acidobacteria bacterium]|nr:PspA/IM30 family protein [Acidobacteriota bacterium]MBI3470271.1 PspA/IM30 family protein [Candidatus Solibacter usitatus]
MALMERVATLIRANLNDLVDKAENPEKMLKQVILDMQNQLMQVKTQVAISIADEQLLAKKTKENEEKAAEYTRKAELAVAKGQDDLARAALERSLAASQMAASFAQQVADQKLNVEDLKTALRKLEQKLQEAQSKCDLLIAQHRRSRTLSKAADARMAIEASPQAGFERMQQKVHRSEAVSQAKNQMAGDNMDDRLAALGREDEIERLLSELKARVHA